jgi:hypothetical protein
MDDKSSRLWSTITLFGATREFMTGREIGCKLLEVQEPVGVPDPPELHPED